jgi:hypothetical protein
VFEEARQNAIDKLRLDCYRLNDEFNREFDAYVELTDKTRAELESRHDELKADNEWEEAEKVTEEMKQLTERMPHALESDND